MSTWRKKIFDVIETESHSLISRIYDWLMLAVIVISLIPLAFRDQTITFVWFDRISVSIFILDYLFRWFTADYKITNCKKWQAFLLYQAGALLPTFWHGGYQRKILIFCHDDLKLVHELNLRYGRDSLHGIKDVLSPKVKMRGNEGTIEYCFWNEWNGLVKETYKVKYEDYTIAQFILLSNEVIYEYDCGICF